MATRIAEHNYLDSNGNPIGNDIKSAAGIRYALQGNTNHWDWNIPGAVVGTPQTMLAVLMSRTLATREAGSVQRDGGDWNSIVEALQGRFDAVARGDWRERVAGEPRGPKYDPAILAQALVDSATDSSKAKPVEFYAEKIRSDRSFAGKVRAQAKVMQRYFELAEVAESDTDSLL